jgi:hypothetical protein
VPHVRYELGFYIPEDGILHSNCREYLRFFRSAIDLAMKLWTCTPFITGNPRPCCRRHERCFSRRCSDLQKPFPRGYVCHSRGEDRLTCNLNPLLFLIIPFVSFHIVIEAVRAGLSSSVLLTLSAASDMLLYRPVQKSVNLGYPVVFTGILRCEPDQGFLERYDSWKQNADDCITKNVQYSLRINDVPDTSCGLLTRRLPFGIISAVFHTP